jgi:hypothetical protein
MKTSVNRLAAVLSFLVLLAACSKRPLNLAALSERPADYNGKIVRVSGCFKADSENSVLLPCRKLDSGAIREAVWIENLDSFEHFESIAPNGQKRRATHEGQLSNTEREQMRRLFGTKTEEPFPVTLEGEFQTGGKYGHLGGFDKQLILYRVVAAAW